MEQKDIEDMDQLMQKCNKDTIRMIIDEILNRDDLFESKKQGFLNHLPWFRRRYHV